MSQIDDNRNFLLDQIQLQEDNLNNAASIGPGLIGGAMWLMYAPWGVPQNIIDQITRIHVTNMNNAIDGGRDLIQYERDAVSAFGSPDALRSASSLLSTDVLDKVSTLLSQVTETKLQSLRDSNWTSDASEQYRASFAEQNDSVERIQTYTTGLINTLDGLADALEGAYDGMGQAIVAVLIGFIAFVASLFTGPGVIAGIVVFVATCVGGIIQAVAVRNELDRATNSVASSVPEPQAWASVTFSI